MEFKLTGFNQPVYMIDDPQGILTPRLVVFQTALNYNLRRMRELLAGVRSDLDLSILCPHVKTHKSSWLTRRMMQEGVHFFKSSPNELEMLLAAGAQEILLAYPLVPQWARQVARMISQHPQVKLFVQLSRPELAPMMAEIASEYEITWHYFIDLDVGMRRTGIAPAEALPLWRRMADESRLVFAGLHAYDGHNHLPTLEERRAEAARSLAPLCQTVREFAAQRITVPRVVVGGTPGFLADAEFLFRQNLDSRIYLSPGTWIYFDSTYGRIMPGTFQPAALILCQVMDQTGAERYTLNLGHKRWAVDQGALEDFSVADMKAVKWSEEHTVVTTSQRMEIGDYLMLVPKHVCSTVNLWEYSIVIGVDGRIEIERCPVDARNR